MVKKLITGLPLLMIHLLPLVGAPHLIVHYKLLTLMLANTLIWYTQPPFTLKETQQNKQTDQYSLVLIMIVSLLSVAVPIIDWAYFRLFYFSLPITIIGFILLWIGVVLRIWSIKILGKQFTAAVRLEKEHSLITEGPYRLIRHPSYLGAWLALIGESLFLNSWIGLTFSLVAMFVIYFIRINAEERLLLQSFGQAYQDYQGRTKKLIPWVW